MNQPSEAVAAVMNLCFLVGWAGVVGEWSWVALVLQSWYIANEIIVISVSAAYVYISFETS